MGYGGAVDHHLGALAAALGRHDDAVTHLRAAVAMHETWGPLPGRLSIGRCLPRTGPNPPHQKDLHRAGNALSREGDAWR